MAGRLVTITTTPTLLCDAKGPSERAWIRLEFHYRNSSNVVQSVEEARIGVGDAAVTATTGLLLQRARAMNIENTALARPAAKAIYGVVASGSVEVLVEENT